MYANRGFYTLKFLKFSIQAVDSVSIESAAPIIFDNTFNMLMHEQKIVKVA